MFDPQCLDKVERVAGFQSQVENHQVGFAFFDESFGTRNVVPDPDTAEVRLTVD
jgi:hypothetical protein